jgi:pSer/pThr/pTyr-binding forkhead associated (FHA) protein
MTRLLTPPGRASDAGRRALTTLLERLAPVHATPTLALPGLENAYLVVGRSRRCDIVVDAPSASRQHAALVLFGGQWFVWDRHSTNGTRVNGRRIWGTASVRPGDVVSFGAATFRLTRPDRKSVV